jgi:hypothetical protein
MPGRRAWAAGAMAGGAAVLAAAAGIPLAGAAGSRTAPDPAGDAGAGFDITSLTVSNTNAGRLSFRIGIPAVTAAPPNMALLIGLDADQKAEANPLEHAITVFAAGAVVIPTNAAGQPGAPFIPASLSTSFAPGVVTVSIAGADVGNPRKLLVGAGSFTLAPDGSPVTVSDTDVVGLSYTLKLPTKLLVRSTSLSPSRPAPGGAFRAGVFVRDTTYGSPGEPASGGRVTCAFTVGGRKVTAARSLTEAGRATCAGTVPRDAAGTTLRGTVTYTLNGATVKRSFSAHVGG